MAAATAFGMSPAWAEIAVNENFAVSGYLVGSARYFETDDFDSSSMDMDAMKLAATAKFAPVTGTLSLYAGADAEPVFLDTYVTYDAGGGTTVTGGKFLSWLGYEAFDPINMLQITYANDFPAAIPAYHAGVKVENSGPSHSVGFAVLDSVYGPTYYMGDGDIDDGAGFEAYYTYKSSALTSFFALAYDMDDDSDTDTLTADWWIQYVTGATTLAAEFCYTEADTSGPNFDGYFWLLLARQAVSDTVSVTGRISGGTTEGGGSDPEFLKFTVAPSVAVTPNLEVMTEASYTSYDNTEADDALFLGVQGRFKF